MLNSSTASSKPTSWKDWFKNRESSKIINTSSKKKLFDAFDASIEKLDCIQKILKYDEVVFLYKQNMGSNKINVFHHMRCIGGLIHQPEEEFGAIEGISENTVGFITPSIDELVAIPLEKPETVPKMEDYMKVTKISDIQNLSARDTNIEYNPRNFIPIPPFLLDSIEKTLEFNKGDAAELFIRVIEDIKNFDLSNDLDEVEEAEKSCDNLLHWFFLVMRKKIYSIPSIICYNKELRTIFKGVNANVFGLEESVNTPSPNAVDLSQLKMPLQMIASNQASAQQAIAKLTEIHDEGNDQLKKSFKKVPPQFKNMMLVAASNGTVKPMEINDEAKEFFRNSDKTQAQLFLNTKLEANKVECTISLALTTLFLYGNFVLPEPTIPSGLSTLVISSKSIGTGNLFFSGIVMDLSSKNEISKSNLNKLTKTQIIIPRTIEEAAERIGAILILSIVFFLKIVFFLET